MSDISPSKLGEKFDATFQAKLDACTTPEMIKILMHDHAITQNLVVEDIYNPNVLHAVDTPQPRSFAKSVVIDGTKHVIEGASEVEVAEREIALYRQIFSQPAAAGTERPRDPATGQFRATAEQQRAAATADDGATEAARLALLRGSMIRGEISVDDYAIQSGAMDRALADAGIDPEALREVSSQRYQQNWQSATDEFLASSDWPGGTENLKRLGLRIIQMNATDQPSVETLRRAYDDLKRESRLVENADTTREKRLAEAKTPAEIREILNYKGGSGVWGAR